MGGLNALLAENIPLPSKWSENGIVPHPKPTQMNKIFPIWILQNKCEAFLCRICADVVLLRTNVFLMAVICQQIAVNCKRADVAAYPFYGVQNVLMLSFYGL